MGESDNADFYKQIFLAISLFPYFNYYMHCQSFENRVMAQSVLFNGILCHGSSALNLKYKKVFFYNDVILNIIFVLYVNYFTTYQPGSIIITLMGTQAWIMNRFEPVSWDRSFKHWVFVQMPALFVLSKY
jgi:hypothetical protein